MSFIPSSREAANAVTDEQESYYVYYGNHNFYIRGGVHTLTSNGAVDLFKIP
jgi:hypothetical protein